MSRTPPDLQAVLPGMDSGLFQNIFFGFTTDYVVTFGTRVDLVTVNYFTHVDVLSFRV